MNSPKYRVFVCTKKRAADRPESCCCDRGALDVYQAFQDEVDRLGLSDRVEIRKSGCLDRCEAGVVAMVAMVVKPNWGLAWLPTKLRVKLRKLLFPNRCLYGNLTINVVRTIAKSHLLGDRIVRQSQISKF